MENTHKNGFELYKVNSTPAWHINAQAFVALLIMIALPLVINLKGVITSIASSGVPAKAPVAEVKKAEPKKANRSLTRFLAAVVFGVGDEGIAIDPETGAERIILPYGGEVEAGGTLPGTGNIDVDRWTSTPTTDGSVPEIRESSRLRNTGGAIGGGGNASAGGSIQSGGMIPSGGFIPGGGYIKSGGTI